MVSTSCVLKTLDGFEILAPLPTTQIPEELTTGYDVASTIVGGDGSTNTISKTRRYKLKGYAPVYEEVDHE